MALHWEPPPLYRKNQGLMLPLFPVCERMESKRKGLVSIAKKGGDFEAEIIKKLQMPRTEYKTKEKERFFPPFYQELVDKTDLPGEKKTEYPAPMLVERLRPTPLPKSVPPRNPLSEADPHSYEWEVTDQEPRRVIPLPQLPSSGQLTCQLCGQPRPSPHLPTFPSCSHRVCADCQGLSLDTRCPICRQ